MVFASDMEQSTRHAPMKAVPTMPEKVVFATGTEQSPIHAHMKAVPTMPEKEASAPGLGEIRRSAKHAPMKDVLTNNAVRGRVCCRHGAKYNSPSKEASALSREWNQETVSIAAVLDVPTVL